MNCVTWPENPMSLMLNQAKKTIELNKLRLLFDRTEEVGAAYDTAIANARYYERHRNENRLDDASYFIRKTSKIASNEEQKWVEPTKKWIKNLGSKAK